MRERQRAGPRAAGHQGAGRREGLQQGLPRQVRGTPSRGRAGGHGGQGRDGPRGRRPGPAGRHVRGGAGRGGRPREPVLRHGHGTGARGGRAGRRGRVAAVHAGAEQHRGLRAAGVPERGQEHAAAGHHPGPAQGGAVPVHHAAAVRGRGAVQRHVRGGGGRPAGADRRLAPQPRAGHIVPAARATVHGAAAAGRPVAAGAVDVRAHAARRGAVLLGRDPGPAAADRGQQDRRGRRARQPGRAAAPAAGRHGRRDIRQARAQPRVAAQAHETRLRRGAGRGRGVSVVRRRRRRRRRSLNRGRSSRDLMSILENYIFYITYYIIIHTVVTRIDLSRKIKLFFNVQHV